MSRAPEWSHRGILGLALQIGFAFLICWASWHCQQPGKMEGRMQHSPLQVPAHSTLGVNQLHLSISMAHYNKPFGILFSRKQARHGMMQHHGLSSDVFEDATLMHE